MVCHCDIHTLVQKKEEKKEEDDEEISYVR